jgi:hypothetical protein
LIQIKGVTRPKRRLAPRKWLDVVNEAMTRPEKIAEDLIRAEPDKLINCLAVFL